jgi:two-component system, OmpR family, response regulator PhoP
MARQILVIEDDALLRDAVDVILTQAGYLVNGVGKAEDGLALLSRWRADLVLLDIRLPGIGGVEALGRLRRAGHRMPVLMMTADNTAATVREVMAAGGDGYVLKPFDPQTLLKRVRAGLAGSGGGRVVVLDV